MPNDDYNYAKFDQYVQSGVEKTEFGAFPKHLHAGEIAPDFTAVRLDDGAQVSMSELWQDRPLVVEFGSFT